MNEWKVKDYYVEVYYGMEAYQTKIRKFESFEEAEEYYNLEVEKSPLEIKMFIEIINPKSNK